MKLVCTLAGLLATAVLSIAQDESYTFTSGPFPGDGFGWPSQINAGQSLFPFNGSYTGRTEFQNDINNALMFSSNYVAAGNSSVIDGNAMWGNPIATDPYMEMFFYEFFEFDYDEELGQEIVLAGVSQVSFDFAWATSAGNPTNPPTIGSILIETYDYDGNGQINAYPLSGTFTHGLGGSGVGREGRITLSGLQNIAEVYIDFSAVAPPGSMAEFAIDNMQIYVGGGGGSGAGPTEVYPISGADQLGIEAETDYGTNVLKGVGPWGFEGGVRNNSGSAAVFSSVFTSPDPELYDPTTAQHTNQPIAQGETYYPGTEWEIDTDTALSGEYSGSITVINHSDPSDPDNTFELVSLKLYDPPALTDNTGTAIDPMGVSQITMSNAAAGPHAGALRASVEVESITISDPRFTMTGIALTDRLDPGQAFNGTVAFDSSGLSSGTYSATLTMGFEMTSTQNYLNQDQPVPNRVWNLQATVGSGGSILPPEIVAFTRSGSTYTITYQSIAGEVFAVKGSADLMNEVDLPNTVVGDGTVKSYMHTPPVGTERYFYRLVRSQ